MKKQNKLVVWLKSLPVAVIFMLWLLNANKFIYAQISSPTAIPNPSLSNTASQNQTSSSVEPKQDSQLIAAIAAFGSLLSGIAAILALRKSQNNEKINDLLSKQIFKDFDFLIKQSKDPIEKQRLLDQKKFFEEELRALTKRSDASKKAGKWLKANRERLAEEAVRYTLVNKSVSKDVSDKLYLHLNDYLHGIEESLLEVADTDYIDELVTDLVSQHVLDSSDYKKALQFIINDKIITSNLSPDSREEIKYYFHYLIRSLP